ncbi:hypothetical protein HDN1F_27880 [gamma proteobacterium HdN1]|nr:hypothetical protein HDN1F_27880 [gamma proteobacterium HdN1]
MPPATRTDANTCQLMILCSFFLEQSAKQVIMQATHTTFAQTKKSPAIHDIRDLPTYPIAPLVPTQDYSSHTMTPTVPQSAMHPPHSPEPDTLNPTSPPRFAATAAEHPIQAMLAQALRGMAPVEVKSLPANVEIAEQLAQSLGFSEAVTLSTALDQPWNYRPEIESFSARSPEEEYRHTQELLINAIHRSCNNDPDYHRIRLPAAEEQPSFERYMRFYATHQQHIDNHLRRLRALLRWHLCEAAPHCQPLASLDAALEEALWTRARKAFGQILRQLEKRFKELHTHQNNTSAHSLFCEDLRQLLLVELDVRLQPIKGLLETYKKEVCDTHE